MGPEDVPKGREAQCARRDLRSHSELMEWAEYCEWSYSSFFMQMLIIRCYVADRTVDVSEASSGLVLLRDALKVEL